MPTRSEKMRGTTGQAWRRRIRVAIGASALLASALALPTPASALQFTRTDYRDRALDYHPEDLAVGDFNADSDPDLAVANEGEGGDDSLDARDGTGFVDSLQCGAGLDTTLADAPDRVGSDCEG